MDDLVKLFGNRGMTFPADKNDWSVNPPSFPSHHFRGGGMSLPFSPFDFAYSPVVDMPVPPLEKGVCWAYYKRGVSKYRRLFSKGGNVEPVIVLISFDGKTAALQDGNHRMAAAQQEGLLSLKCRIGMPRRMFDAWEQTAKISKGVAPP